MSYRIVSSLTALGTGEAVQVTTVADTKLEAYRRLSDRIQFQARSWGMHPALIQQSNQFFGAFNEETI